jgi:chromosomal replication initiator protein
MDVTILWQKVLKMLENSNYVSQVVFDNLIKPLTPISYENGEFTVKIKNDFHKPSLLRYSLEITRYIRSITDNNEAELIIVSPEDDVTVKPNKVVNYTKTNLNPRYTFDTFVAGGCNELAYAASRAVADSPGKNNAYNPLFLYGGVGLGKTHLINSIGNQIHDNNPNIKVLYATSEDFVREFIASFGVGNNNASFENKYRGTDVLLIDDVQFLEGKEKTQDAMFHTFNELIRKNKQIVFTSDVPPSELKNLEARLTSRFSSGLIADVSIPDYETRTAILEKKLEMKGLEIPQPVKEFIIKNIVSNIRDLEGALHTVSAYADLTNKKMTLELAQQALKDKLVGQVKPEITLDFICITVADYFKIHVDDLSNKKRPANLVIPRQIAVYLCRMLTDASQPELGRFFKRNHSTIGYSVTQITQALENEEKIRLIVDELEFKIKGE